MVLGDRVLPDGSVITKSGKTIGPGYLLFADTYVIRLIKCAGRPTDADGQ